MKPTTFKFGQMLIEVGDGASPEVFTAPCGLRTKSFNLQVETQEDNVPDCDDPDAPAWKEREVTGLSRDITGEGVLADEFLTTWDDWATSGNPRNVRITVGDYVWTGAYFLTGFEITGQIGNKVNVSVTMQSDGEVTRALESDGV